MNTCRRLQGGALPNGYGFPLLLTSILLALVVAPGAQAQIQINSITFGNYDFESPPIDAGYRDLPRMMADVNGDGSADFCRFVGSSPNIFLSCALAGAWGFGQYDWNSYPGFDWGWRKYPGAGMADVDADGRADYCRWVGDEPWVVYSCARSLPTGGFGFRDFTGYQNVPWRQNTNGAVAWFPITLADANADGDADYCQVDGSGAHCALRAPQNTENYAFSGGTVAVWQGYDFGYRDRPRLWADVNGDRRVDYCRFVGNPPGVFLSCGLNNGGSFGWYDVNSVGGYDIGWSNRLRAFADVDADGRADYCRFVGDGAGIRLSCGLTRGNVIQHAGAGSSTVGAGFDPGLSGFPAWMADVNGDGRADYCRFVGNPVRLSCALAWVLTW